jgi:ubiquinone/menaquinone biosynthesis C-methylase UbiE
MQRGSDFFEQWDPDGFAKQASYMRTIECFTRGHIAGDVLDVGCGSRVYYDLTNALSWTGLDISRRMISSVEFSTKTKNMAMKQGDVLEMPFSDKSFDTVCCLFLIHHLGAVSQSVSAKRVTMALREMRRVLRCGGKLIIAENCRGPLNAPYHAAFPLLYQLMRSAFSVELPYFWKLGRMIQLTSEAGFSATGSYAHIPQTESIYQPMLKTHLPAWLTGDLIQRMTLFILEAK